MKKRKKGQLSLFLLIGVIVVILAIAVYFFISEKSNEAYFLSPEIKPSLDSIKVQTKDCLKSVSNDALRTIGLRGGYYKKPSRKADYLDIGDNFIPYYYERGRYLMPEKERIESEISRYVTEKLDYCFKQMETEGFELDYGKPDVETAIEKGVVKIKVDLPITISKDNRKIVLETSQYPVYLDSALYDIVDVASYITDSHKQDEVWYCISCLGEMAEEKDLYINMINFVNNETLVIIWENHTSQEPYYFEFLNKYTGREKSKILQSKEGEPVPSVP